MTNNKPLLTPAELNSLNDQEARLVVWIANAGGKMTKTDLRKRCRTMEQVRAVIMAMDSLIERGLVVVYTDHAATIGRRAGRAPMVAELQVQLEQQPQAAANV